MTGRSEAFNAIDRLKELQPDWDSYGACEITLSAREQAKRFIALVERALGARYANPLVGPTADGGVVLIWRQRPGPEVEAFFAPDGSRRYVVLDGGRLVGRGPIEDPEFLRQYVTD
jgi:hypothetical protein